MSRLFFLFFLVITLAFTSICTAEQRNDPREQALSDTLDLWREGRFEQLYDSLSHRSGMTRERFVQNMKDVEIKPVCCFNKLNAFRLISEKRTTAKVFARLGMEGGPGTDASQSREFTLDHEEGRWKMRMTDVKNLAGAKKKKSHVSRVKKLSH
ncbi:MAG: hypothetical protein OEL57_05860 [Trichlorobacter sp.]|uniref:hypothetical protein n=1 Tax=Trichlorobacter sp. TaxID=2911007 RepID=UPI00256918A4|nr:hypothetical protein [Trichlorobacter sp.]MDK9717420.1 hypothetical protein [Trichlorobacter sp.]